MVFLLQRPVSTITSEVGVEAVLGFQFPNLLLVSPGKIHFGEFRVFDV